MFGKESSKVDHAGIMNPGPVGITARCHYIHYRFTSYIRQNATNWVWYIVGLHSLFWSKIITWDTLHSTDWHSFDPIISEQIVKKSKNSESSVWSSGSFASYLTSCIITLKIHFLHLWVREEHICQYSPFLWTLSVGGKRWWHSLCMLALHFKKHQRFLPLIFVSLCGKCWEKIVWN